MPLGVILAGGLGTRMRPLTDLRPKPSLLVAGEPVVGHQLRWLAGVGIDRVIVTTSYLAEELQAAIGDGRQYGVDLRFAHETRPLGTGGAAANAVRDLAAGELVVVANGDQLTRHDLRRHLDSHLGSGAAVTIHGRRVDDARPFGLLELAGDRIIGFREKPAEPVAAVVNSGTYVVRAGLLHQVAEATPTSLERDVFPSLIASGADLRCYEDNAYSLDVGSASALLQAGLDVVTRTGAIARVDGLVAPTASVDGGSWIGQTARVGEHAVVHASVVMPGATIGDAAVVDHSLVAQDAVIAPGVRLKDNVIGEGAQVTHSPTAGAVIGTGEVC